MEAAELLRFGIGTYRKEENTPDPLQLVESFYALLMLDEICLPTYFGSDVDDFLFFLPGVRGCSNAEQLLADLLVFRASYLKDETEGIFEASVFRSGERSDYRQGCTKTARPCHRAVGRRGTEEGS